MFNLMLVPPSIPGKNFVIRHTAKLAAKAAKHSPELCIGAGIVCGVGATVLACRATLKVGAVLDEYNQNLNNINFVMETKESDPSQFTDYSVEDCQRDKFINLVQTAVKIGKLYAPAVIFGAASIAFVLTGHHIMLKRQAALTMAYTAVQTAFDNYRKRVAEEVGEEKENDIYNGVRTKVIEAKDEKGKKVKKTEESLERPFDPYTRIFDESSCWWRPDAEANKFFLARVQAQANDILRIKKHLFLNEVYEMLDMEPTSEGQLVGWLYGNDNGGDNFVSFGIWDGEKEGSRRFINCLERNVWLTFNVDGVIYDKI